MKPITPDTLLDALNWRYATKVFDPAKTIAPELWKILEASLVLTPSSFGLQPYRFIVVTEPALKAKLRAASINQAQVEDCSHLVVFTARRAMTEGDVDHYINRISSVRGVPAGALAPFKAMMVAKVVTGTARPASEWAAAQAYIALGQFMASAALLGVDACPLEGLDPLQYDAILGLEGTPFHTVVACPAGYRGEGDKYATQAKVRFPAEELVENR